VSTAEKMKQARDSVAAQNARDRAAWPASGPTPHRTPAATPREQRPDAMATAPPLSDEQTFQRQPRLLLSADDLRDLGLRYSRSKLYKLMALGLFPKATKLSAFRSAWFADEVYAWIEAKKQDRTGPVPASLAKAAARKAKAAARKAKTKMKKAA
jgi:predicted DNA-binding transcriptional regulator AlpA